VTPPPEKIIIAVGSTRRPKVEAVREAMALVAPRLPAHCECEIVGVEVPSGVGHTPLSREQTMLGARQRAEALVEMNRAQAGNWRYFVGLEGGLDVIAPDGASASELRQQWLVFLQNWAYVSDGHAGAYGQSGGVALPEALARMVVDEGMELAHAVDAFAGQHGIRDRQGAWGILTGGVITRQDAFRIAVINAFAPLLNRTAYAKAEATHDAFPR
jgi:inosine/xanthosine triphosphatase